MRKQAIKASFTSTGLLIIGLSASLYSDATVASDYCSSPKLYATNIRESCNQFGVNGMHALYQSSEFISGLKALDQSGPAKRIRAKKLGSEKAS